MEQMTLTLTRDEWQLVMTAALLGTGLTAAPEREPTRAAVMALIDEAKSAEKVTDG